MLHFSDGASPHSFHFCTCVHFRRLRHQCVYYRYKKGSHPKGRAVFLKDAEPFIQWLEEAEEDGEDDE